MKLSLQLPSALSSARLFTHLHHLTPVLIALTISTQLSATSSSSVTAQEKLTDRTAQEHEQHQPKSSLSDADVNAYMNAMVVNDFNIHRVQFSQAIDYLDSIIAPFGLQLYFHQTDDRDPIVDLKTRKLTMSRNLSFLCQQAGYDWWVEDGIIIIAEPGSDEALITEIIPIHSTTVRRLTIAELALQ